MNNPYEDLFKTAAKPDPTQPGLAPAVPPADDDMLDDRHKTRKTNLRLLVVYILGLVIVNVAIYAIYFLTYGDPVATQANIVEVDVQFIPSESSLYPDDPFAVILDGRFENHNTFRLGKIVADFTFLDGEGNTVGTSSYSLDHVEPTAALIVHDVLYFDTAVASIEYEWGFDMSSTFYLAVNAIHTISIALIFILLDRAHFADRWRRTKKGWKQALGGIVTGEIMVYMALLFSSILMERLGITTGSENDDRLAVQAGPGHPRHPLPHPLRLHADRRGDDLPQSPVRLLPEETRPDPPDPALRSHLRFDARRHRRRSAPGDPVCDDGLRVRLCLLVIGSQHLRDDGGPLPEQLHFLSDLRRRALRLHLLSESKKKSAVANGRLFFRFIGLVP